MSWPDGKPGIDVAMTQETCDYCFKSLTNGGVLMPFDRDVMGSDDKVQCLFCAECAAKFPSEPEE